MKLNLYACKSAAAILTLTVGVAIFCVFTSLQASAQQSNPIVRMETSKGPLVIEVFINQAPNTARNFLDLVNRGFYNGLTFHRVETWCIQGGDPNGDGTGSFTDPATGQPRYLNLEISPQLRHKPGVLAMARSDNPNSASCQFYITKGQTSFLDGKYAVFGRVINGMAGMHTVYGVNVGDRIISAAVQSPDGNNVDTGAGQPSSPPARSSAPTKDSGF